MLNVNRAGLNPVRMANGVAKNINPIGHRKAWSNVEERSE
jgi:hypothetical protein